MELLLVASVFVVSIAALQRATGAGRRNLILVVLLVGSLAAVPHFLRKPAAGTDGESGHAAGAGASEGFWLRVFEGLPYLPSV